MMTARLVALVSILVLGSLSASCRSGIDNHGSSDSRPYMADVASWAWPAQSLAEVVAGSEVIVRGWFVLPGEVDVIYPDGYDGDCCSEFDGGPGASFTPVSFRVEEYIKGSGPAELLILQPGDLLRTRGFAFFPEPDYGEETIVFALQWNEGANTWHTHNGIWGRVVIRDGVAVLPQDPFEQRPSPYFPDATSLDDVAAAVRSHLE